MSSDFDNHLLKEGILCFKAGEFDSARRFFERALDIADDNPTRTAACWYLSRLTTDPVKKRSYLESTLALDPVHPEARRALAILDGRLDPGEIIDPDAIPAPPPGEVEISSDRFTCPTCGGRMVYSADGRSLLCEFCARRQSLGGKIAPDQDFFAAMASRKGHRKPVSTQVGRCGGCGAEFILAPQVISTSCAWCGSAQVVRQGRELAAPDSILPFGFDQDAALGYLSAWAARRKPSLSTPLRPPHPLYLPVWTFDLVGDIPWNGKTYHQEKWVPVSGTRAVLYHNIPVPATPRLPGLFPRLLQGLDLSLTAPFDPRYLVGWPAEVHSIPLAEAALEARRLAVERIRREVHLEHGLITELHYKPSAVAVDAYNLLLVPAWLADLPFKDRSLPALVEGVTGAVHADLPPRGLLRALFDSP